MRPWRGDDGVDRGVNAPESVTSNAAASPPTSSAATFGSVGVEVVHDEVGAVGGEAASRRRRPDPSRHR